MAKHTAKVANTGSKDVAAGKDLLNQAATGAGAWNDYATQTAQQAQDYAQNNPYSQAATPYIQNLLSGSMANKPWESNLYGNISGQSPDQILAWLGTYMGNPSTGGGGGGHNPPAAHGGVPMVNGSYYTGETSGRANAGKGGKNGANYVPDTITGSDSFFAQQTRDMFDPKHLDPANDPTLQPVIDAIQKNAMKDYLQNAAALQMQAEAGGRYGGGLYQQMQNQQVQTQTDSTSAAIAQQLMGAYQAQENRMANQLQLVNQRDLGAMSDMTQRAAIDAQSGAAAAAAASAERTAAAERQLQAAGLVLNAQMGMLGMKGDMASLMQQGQLGALNAGLGYGQLGMSGFNTGLNAGQLGMGALGMQANIGQGLYNSGIEQGQWAQQFNLQQQQADWQHQQQQFQNQMMQLQGQQSSVNDYLNLLMGIGGMGGSTFQSSPGQYVPSMDPTTAGIIGGVGGYLQGYGGQQAGGGG